MPWLELIARQLENIGRPGDRESDDWIFWVRARKPMGEVRGNAHRGCKSLLACRCPISIPMTELCATAKGACSRCKPLK